MNYLRADQIVELGILQEANRTFFHMIGLALEVNPNNGTLRLQDHRDDMEGIAFDDAALSREKYKRFVDYAQPRLEARLAGVGFLEQPIPDPDARDAPAPAAEELSDGQENCQPNLRLVVHRRKSSPARPEWPDGDGGAA
jgi:hypothetical protein